MEKKADVKIELRSEKVRSIISKEPPFWVRHGISIITLLLIIAAAVVWFFIFSSSGLQLPKVRVAGL